MLRKRPYMLVYCARISQSSAQSIQEQSIFHMPLAAHPNGSAGGLLGAQSGHAEQALASAQAPRYACSPDSICPVNIMAGGHMSLAWRGALQLPAADHVDIPGVSNRGQMCHLGRPRDVLAHLLSVLVERQTSQDFLFKHTPFCSLSLKTSPSTSTWLRPLWTASVASCLHKGSYLCRLPCCAAFIVYPASQPGKCICSWGCLSTEPFAYSSG